MEVLIRNTHGELSHRDRDYAVKKLSFLDRFLHTAERAEFVHREENKEHFVEVTVFADGRTIRSVEHNSSLRAAIDLASEKLDLQLRKVKDRLSSKRRPA